MRRWWTSLQMLLTSQCFVLVLQNVHMTRHFKMPLLQAAPFTGGRLKGEMRIHRDFRQPELPFWSYVTAPPPLFSPPDLWHLFLPLASISLQARRAPASILSASSFLSSPIYPLLSPPLIPALFCHFARPFPHSLSSVLSSNANLSHLYPGSRRDQGRPWGGIVVWGLRTPAATMSILIQAIIKYLLKEAFDASMRYYIFYIV